MSLALSTEAPQSKCMTEGRRARVFTLGTSHDDAMRVEDIHISPEEASNAARKGFRIHDFTTPPAESQFPFQLISLKSKPPSNLSPAEGDLSSCWVSTPKTVLSLIIQLPMSKIGDRYSECNIRNAAMSMEVGKS